MCAEFVPPKSDDPRLEKFFDEWVYGTGMPELKLSYSVRGKPGAWKLIGSVTQSGVPDDFTVRVPIEVQAGRGTAKSVQVSTGADRVPFSIPVSSPNAKAVLDPHWSVLRR